MAVQNISLQAEKKASRLQRGRDLRPALARHAAVLLPPEVTGRRVIAGVIALLIVTGMFFYASRVPQRMRMHAPVDGVNPADGEGMQAEVQFSDLQISQATGSDPLELRGRVSNAGNHQITGAIVQLTFRDSAGKRISTIQKPILSMTAPADPGVSHDFSGDPIEPDESRAFRVLVPSAPARWDHNLPEVKVITVSSDLE
jgi:hypothetical protein